jgi:hypothetical protein
MSMEQVEVIQADREAAASSVVRRLKHQYGCELPWMDASTASMRMGEQDLHDEVQAFARHRIAHAKQPDAERVGELRERFRDACGRLSGVTERLAKGQQFNAYECASNDEDDDPEDWEFVIAIGPINSHRNLFEVTGESLADLLSSALKLAALNTGADV